MDKDTLQKKIKEIDEQMEQVEQRANAQLNQLAGKKQGFKELLAEIAGEELDEDEVEQPTVNSKK